MNCSVDCRETERLLNEKLDAPANWSAASERAIEAHCASCPPCRELSARYQTLALAIGAVSRPLPPADFVERVLIAAAEPTRPGVFSLATVKRLAPLASAAALVAAATVGLRLWGPTGHDAPATVAVTVTSPPVREVDPAELTAALSDVTTATLALAREASAPAARVGRGVIDTTDFTESTPVISFPGSVVPSAETWLGVGRRVNAGVAPISGTARSAFGFLLGTTASPGPTNPPPPPRGA